MRVDNNMKKCKSLSLEATLILYFHIYDELVVQDGLIIHGDREVIPKALRKEMIKIYTQHTRG